MTPTDKGIDIVNASADEIDAAMRRGVRAALRRHKLAGVPAIVWDNVNKVIVKLPPDQIPDFPDDEPAGGNAEPGE